MKTIKNIFASLIFFAAILVEINAITLNTQSSVHQILVACYLILSVLMLIYAYLLADFSGKKE
jgi:hypothetical protein